MGIVFILVYLILITRLWHVQISSGESHREKISQQSIRQIRTPATRGRIFCSGGEILADNRPSFDINLHLSEMRQPGKRSNTINYILEQIQKISTAIGKESTFRKEDILAHMNYYPALPMTIFRDVDSKELAAAFEITPPIPGMSIDTVPVRFYPWKTMAPHLLGYLGMDNPKSAKDRGKYFYYIPDRIGICGLEKAYEKIPGQKKEKLRGLRGVAGKSIVRVDHLGYIHEILDTKFPKSGNDITLTIDWKAQFTAEKLLQGKNGAIVLLNAETGAVLAMVSTPGYDLSNFTPTVSGPYLNRLYANPNRPLLNRACNGKYTPGSIVKPLVALALLKDGKDPKETIFCDGANYIGNARIRCWIWRQGGHGKVTLLNALQKSCNDYFTENGVKLGLTKIAEMFKSAGIGEKTGFILPEQPGTLPSRELQYQRFKQHWNSYNTALTSIGQGLIEVTPLQVAVYTAAIANGGTLWHPYILKNLRDPKGNILFLNTPYKLGHLDTTKHNLELVQKGMWMVVNSPEGSAKKARNDKIILSAKTGTAEMGPRSARYTNTWFTCFGRYKGKLYALTVFVEKGQSGGRTCAPIASQFFNEWLSD
jgi:penicillin-binding protein 2